MRSINVLTSDLQLASPRLRVKGWCVTLLLLLTTPSSKISGKKICIFKKCFCFKYLILY